MFEHCSFVRSPGRLFSSSFLTCDICCIITGAKIEINFYFLFLHGHFIVHARILGKAILLWIYARMKQKRMIDHLHASDE